MKNKYNIHFLFLASLLLPFLGFGQTKSPILQKYIDEGLERNLAIRQQDLQIEKAWKSVEIAQSQLSPTVAFAPNYTLAAGGRRLQFPVGDLLNPVYSTLNALTQSQAFPQIENVNEQLAPNNFHETKLTIQYPIFSNKAKYGILINRELWKAEETTKKKLLYDLQFGIEQAYYQYLQVTEARQIAQVSIDLVEEYIQFNQKLVTNQVALPDVLLTLQFERNKALERRAELDKNEQLARAYFNYLLYKPLDSPILQDSTAWTSIYVPTLPLEEYVAQALRERLELQQLSDGVRLAQLGVEFQEKEAYLPTVFAGGNVGFQGFGYQFTNQGFAILQLGLQWDIFHGFEKKKKIAQAKIQHQLIDSKQAEAKQQIELQVTQSYYQAITAQKGIETAESGKKQAEQIRSLVEKRYRNGQALFIELQKAQTDWEVASIQYSLKKYEASLAYLQLRKVSAY
jgi:outer membrane protein TolC